MKNKNEEVQLSEPDDYRREIEQVAYSYWEKRGHEDGHDMEDWLTAEQEVIRRHAPQTADRRRQANAA